VAHVVAVFSAELFEAMNASSFAAASRLKSSSALAYPKAMARTEHTINDALAELLRSTRRAWRDERVVTSEDTGQLKDTSGRPDILVIEPNVCPVVIETEVFPAAIVEAEASSRLTTAYQRIGQLHELAGGDSEAVHAEMMAKGTGHAVGSERQQKESRAKAAGEYIDSHAAREMELMV
jgi:hypothetical protein